MSVDGVGSVGQRFDDDELPLRSEQGTSSSARAPTRVLARCGERQALGGQRSCSGRDSDVVLVGVTGLEHAGSRPVAVEPSGPDTGGLDVRTRRGGGTFATSGGEDV